MLRKHTVLSVSFGMGALYLALCWPTLSAPRAARVEQRAAAQQVAPREPASAPPSAAVTATAQPATPSAPFDPGKLDGVQRQQFLDERHLRWAAQLDQAIAAEDNDASWTEELRAKTRMAIGMFAPQGVEQVSLDCGNSLCRSTFEFEDEATQARVEAMLRSLSPVIGGDAWVMRQAGDEPRRSTVYLARGTQLLSKMAAL
jgi:hypothetical protein